MRPKISKSKANNNNNNKLYNTLITFINNYYY